MELQRPLATTEEPRSPRPDQKKESAVFRRDGRQQKFKKL